MERRREEREEESSDCGNVSAMVRPGSVLLVSMIWTECVLGELWV